MPVIIRHKLRMPAAPPSKKKIIKNKGEVFNQLSINQPKLVPINKPANNSVATLEKVLTNETFKF